MALPVAFTPSTASGPVPTAPWGWPGQQVLSAGGYPSQAWREVPELTWPHALHVFHRMSRDPMVGSVEQAVTTPILRTGWHLGDQDVDPAVTRFIEAELGLDDPETGRAVRHAAGGVAWRTLLGDLLLALRYGHMVHEFVFELHDGLIGLAKLAPRDPRSIDYWWTDTSGQVLGISQTVAVQQGQQVPGPRDVGLPNGTLRWEQRTILAERLLVHTHRSEAGDVIGRSIYEGMYRPWFMKDQMMRFAMIAADRGSSGIPVYKFAGGGDRDKALEVVQNLRSGEESGAAIPVEDELEILGFEPGMDMLPWVRWCNEEIAQATQAMVLTLGHDAGARALGDTFADIFARSLDGVVDDIETTITEGVIRPLVELNFGPGTAYPTLVGDAIQSDSAVVLNALATLVDKGIITPDQPLEDSLRRRLRIPKADQVRTAAEREAAGKPPAVTPAKDAAVASATLKLAEKIIAKETTP